MAGRAPDSPDGALPLRSLRPQKDPPVKTLKKARVGTLVAGSACVAGLTAAGAASAAARAATINDGIDTQDRSLSVRPRRYLAKRLVPATPTK
jgi:hypothetical protein